MMKKISRHFSLDEKLNFIEVSPGFPIIKVNNKWASATISLYGGQILEFQPHDQIKPVLWLSDKAIYKHGKAIRGGVPICWPWFGDYDDGSLFAEGSSLPAHGFARTLMWDIVSTESLANDVTQIVLHMPCQKNCQQYQTIQPHFECDLKLKISISKELKLELMTSNRGDHEVSISNALHAYFNVSDIHNLSISGLEQVSYSDKLQEGKMFMQETEFSLTQETDRIYVDTKSDVTLNDTGFSRTITIKKQNSLSTVVWNPWYENSKCMSDMSDEAWLSMVCIEPANVHTNQTTLQPGEIQQLTTSITVENGVCDNILK
ncbi:MAG: D-hexose-6-phosphate mutarotase [gamma proteobacterium symbiont of Lucinoma myriamae]|nr:D-hexose-6-phosphate mutarotase [gamma proteobacterium symbiont of Lucinoma myriamae]MCU7819146.1 D-hexose-6-phosphate mutarotase [gamma proteobacterium symbiont of Lucinoma myriamae]MCU7833269.1 D-hexose-6-phosphate mutarotase [gamma proteobacterium symbiont of Lucinoma myriamae]